MNRHRRGTGIVDDDDDESKDTVPLLQPPKKQRARFNSRGRERTPSGSRTPSTKRLSKTQMGEILVQAACDGDVSTVNQMLLKGADVDYTEAKGEYTALIKACRMQRVAVVDVLLDNSAQPNKASRNGWTALIESARVGHLKLTKKLLGLPSIEINKTNAMGWPPLIEACRNNHLHIVRLMCEMGASVLIRDRDNLTPRVHTSNPAIWEVLDARWEEEVKENGGDPDEERMKNEAHRAKVAERPEDRLVMAASEGDVNTITDLLNSKVDVNAVSTDGAYTSLTMACRYEKPKAVKLLLERGADYNKGSTCGWTPMIEACRVGSQICMNILRDFAGEKVDVNKAQEFGWPPIIEACRNSHYEVVEQLVDWGASVTIIDGDGDQPIDHATDPWIIALLKDQKKFGSTGPRSMMKAAYQMSVKEQADAGRHQAIILGIVNKIDHQLRQQEADEEYALASRSSVFSVITERLDHESLDEVLKDDGYRQMVLTQHPGFLRDLVKLGVPTSEEKMSSRLNSIVATGRAILNNIFPIGSDSKTRLQYVNHSEKGQHAASLAFYLFGHEITNALRDDDAKIYMQNEGLPWKARWYINLGMSLLRMGCNIESIEDSGATILTYMLKPVPYILTLKGAIQQLLTAYTAVFKKYKSNLNQECVNVEFGGYSALGYLVRTNEDVDQLVVMHLESGAKMPSDNMAASRLFGRLQLLASRGVYQAWRISRSAVSNGDIKLMKLLLNDVQFPVFMTDPTKTETKTKQSKWRHPSASFSNINECLLHIAINRQNIEMFQLLIDYGSQSSSAVWNDGPWAPWPDERFDDVDIVSKRSYSESNGGSGGDDSNICNPRVVAWTDSYGHTPFHMVVNTRRDVSKARQMFASLLSLDEGAVVVHTDNYGWTAAHYAAYHNQLEIIHLLMENHIELTGTTQNVGPDQKGQTPLHKASMRGNWAVVLAILKATGDEHVEVIDRNGCTPLALAMLARQRLIERQAGDDDDDVEEVQEEVDVEDDKKKDDNDDGDEKKAADAADNDNVSPTAIVSPAKLGSSALQLQEEQGLVNEQFAEDERLGLETSIYSDDESSDDSRLLPSDVVKLHETFNITIQGLLKHGASIQQAASQSGKTLQELMNVSERWTIFCRDINSIDLEEQTEFDDYYDYIRGKRQTSTPTYEERRERRHTLENRLKVYTTRREELFTDKETQIVIQKKYDEKIRTRLFARLARFFIMLVALTVLAIHQATGDSGHAYFMQRGLSALLPENVFDYGISEIPKTFAEIDGDIDEMYMFLRGPLLDSFYPSQYGKVLWHGTQSLSEVGKLVSQNRVLGVPRLRQLRAKRESCDVASGFPTHTCFSEEYDTSPYGVGLSASVWKSESELKGIPHWGRTFAFYPGSGYAKDLPTLFSATSRTDAETLFNDMETNRWIDQATRALFVEFTLFNPSAKQFMVCTLTLEMPLSGGIIASWQFSATKLRRDVTTWDNIVIYLEWIVAILALLHFRSEIMQFRRLKLSDYVSSFYNWADWIILVGLTIIIILRYNEPRFEDDLDYNNNNTFLPSSELNRLQQYETIIYSIIVLMAWFKLFDYLTVFNDLYKLIVMIEMMAARLINWFIVFCVVLAGFTTAEYVAYGYKDEAQYVLVWGFMNRFLGVFAGSPIIQSHHLEDRILGTTFSVLFVLSTTLLLLNLIIALLTSAYMEASNQSLEEIAYRQYLKLRENQFTMLNDDTTAKDGYIYIMIEADYDALTADMMFRSIRWLKDRFDQWGVPARMKQREARLLKRRQREEEFLTRNIVRIHELHNDNNDDDDDDVAVNEVVIPIANASSSDK